jgi:hypothetical protein
MSPAFMTCIAPACVIGQQAEAQRTAVDEVRRDSVKLRAQLLDQLYTDAVVTQEDIAESEHECDRRCRTSLRSHAGVISGPAASVSVLRDTERHSAPSLGFAIVAAIGPLPLMINRKFRRARSRGVGCRRATGDAAGIPES